MRFLADENFPLPAVQVLRTKGHDVQTLQEIGEAGRAYADDSVLARAAAEGRCVLTLNRRDFISLHRQGAVHAGIVVCTFDVDFSGLADRVDALVREVSSLSGRLLRVHKTGGSVDA